MRVIGIDDDTSNTGLALVAAHPEGPRLLRVGLARAKGKSEERRARMALAIREELHRLLDGLEPDETFGVVEWQQIRKNDRAKPNNMMSLNAVAGMGVCALTEVIPPENIWTPTPPAWTKGVDKPRLHRRSMRSVGILDVVSVPGGGKIPKSYRTHILCGIGLALWGLKQANLRRLLQRQDPSLV